MLIVRPDFDRRIDLPGVGPCRRPVDIDRTRAPLDRLVSLRVYSFDRGVTIDGEAEADEVFVVLMRGEADVAVTAADQRFGPFRLRADADRAVYLPPHASYRLTAVGDCDIAYARAAPVGEAPPPASFGGSGARATAMHFMLTTAQDEELALPGTPERFLHVRSDDGAGAALNGEVLGDWDSVVLGDGEPALLTISEGLVDILTISVAQR